MVTHRFTGNLKTINSTITIIVALNIFLSGCASSGKNSGSYIYTISKGDKFVLKRDLPIITRDRHVHLQNGELMYYANLDKYKPYCRFSVDQEGEITIRPDTLTVTRVTRNQVWETTSEYNYSVKFDLRATNNPNIKSLSCGAWGSTTDSYITFGQMQQALGNFFEIPKP